MIRVDDLSYKRDYLLVSIHNFWGIDRQQFERVNSHKNCTNIGIDFVSLEAQSKIVKDCGLIQVVQRNHVLNRFQRLLI